MNLKVVIVDDEPAARNVLIQMLSHQYEGIVIVGQAGNVVDAVSILKKCAPDVLLLDVQLEGGTGFDILDKLQPIQFKVIFTTAYDTFAIQAFRYSAIDYLLKPIDPEDLNQAIGKAISTSNYEIFNQQIGHLLSATRAQNFEKIVIETPHGPVFLKTNDIVHMQSYGNYTFVYQVSGERLIASNNLKFFEQTLSDNIFIRVHQSHIVNADYIKAINKISYHLSLINGEEIPLARRRISNVEKLLRIVSTKEKNQRR